MAKKGGLGKGLNALFADNAQESGILTLKISEVEPNKANPRVDFDEQALMELSESIAEHGVLQPIVVRPIPTGYYQIVAGERRWRASRMAGLTEIPAIIKELDDITTMEIALIENLQRENLNPIEEARGYSMLMELHGMTQEQVAKRVGRSRPAVANAIRLLSLPPNVVDSVRSGEISVGHAKALLMFSPERIHDTFERIRAANLTVRQLEEMSKDDKPDSHTPVKTGKPQKRDNYYKELEIILTNELGRRVRVLPKQGGSGTLELEFLDKDDLKSISEVMMTIKKN